MSITLTGHGLALRLPADLYWPDEYAWSPVTQAVDRAVTGALIVQAATNLAGRPITLQPIDDTSAWMPQATLTTLQAWAAEPGLEMRLALRGTERSVLFRHHDGAAIEAAPVVFFSDAGAGDFYLVTLRFMEL